MKKVFVVLAIICFMVSAAYAAVDSWKPANQLTVAWDAVTTHGDGSALPEEAVISYEIVLAGEDHSNPVVLWSGESLTATLTLTQFGRFVIGIKSVMKVAGVVVSESEYGWSDDLLTATSGTFGVLYYKAPAKIVGFQMQ